MFDPKVFLATIGSGKTKVELHKGQTAFSQGDPADAVFYIQKGKVELKVLRGLETYVSGQSGIIIDYAKARRCGEPISTATTESTVQWLLRRRMDATQQMCWSPRGAHLMLKVRTAVMNGTFDRGHTAAEWHAKRPYRRQAA